MGLVSIVGIPVPLSNNWLKVKLKGTQSNKSGIGSLIEISIEGQVQYRYTHCGEGYLAQNSGTEFFGLGDKSVIDYIKVKWLSGIEDILYDININQLVKITEGSTLSIEDNAFSDFSFYPNPTDGLIHFKTNNTILKSVSIYSLQGQLISKTDARQNNISIDFSGYESGLYICELKDLNSKTQSIKVLKY